MNNKLKAQIVLKYGTQADFALAINEDETNISRIVRGRRQLDPTRRQIWAKALDCKPDDIFKEVRT